MWVWFGVCRFGFGLWKGLWISDGRVGFCWWDGLWKSGRGGVGVSWILIISAVSREYRYKL